MKVFANGKLVDVEFGQRFYVGRCGSGRSCFGEFAVLERSTKSHLVFKTDSGAVVKTHLDDLGTVGKAANSHYFVSMIVDGRDTANYIHENVKYWNDKKLCFEKK